MGWLRCCRSLSAGGVGLPSSYRPSVARTEQTSSAQRVATSPINGFIFVSFRLVLGFRGRCRRGLSCEPLGFQTLAVLRECCLGDLMLVHCRFGVPLTERPTRFPLGPADLLRWCISARRLHHFLAFGRALPEARSLTPPHSVGAALRAVMLLRLFQRPD
jgi:hypothetical protein